MREIKFRAWDKRYKMMAASACDEWVSFDGQPYQVASRKYDTPNTEIEPTGDYILMQYTGLKDKEGREIYESDIVRSIYQDTPYAITFENGCFMWGEYPLMVQDDDEGRVEILKETTWCEVIGNIYESPELLERKKL